MPKGGGEEEEGEEGKARRGWPPEPEHLCVCVTTYLRDAVGGGRGAPSGDN